MPLYDYACADGHTTEALVSFDGRDAPRFCTKSVPIDPKPSVLDLIEAVAEGSFVSGMRFCNKSLAKAPSAPSAFPGAGDWRR